MKILKLDIFILEINQILALALMDKHAEQLVWSNTLNVEYEMKNKVQ